MIWSIVCSCYILYLYRKLRAAEAPVAPAKVDASPLDVEIAGLVARINALDAASPRDKN